MIRNYGERELNEYLTWEPSYERNVVQNWDGYGSGIFVIVQVPVNVHREQSVKREKTKKVQQSDVYYQHLSQHVSGIIMPIFRRTKTLLLHLVCCSGSAGCGWQRLWGVVLQDVIIMKVSVLLNGNLHSAHILQDSARQPLPTTSSRTRTTHQVQ